MTTTTMSMRTTACTLLTTLLVLAHVSPGRTQVTGVVYRNLTADSLERCLLHCRHEGRNCRSVGFCPYVGLQQPLCVLYEASREENGSVHDLDHYQRCYLAQKTCLPTANILANRICDQPWAFERRPGKRLKSRWFVASPPARATRIVSKEQCLAECALMRGICRAVQLRPSSPSTCDILTISWTAVSDPREYFADGDGDTDLYENSCFRWPVLDEKSCTFEIGSQEYDASSVLFDERHMDVRSANDCHRLCLNRRNVLCVWYGYAERPRICYLAHDDQRSSSSALDYFPWRMHRPPHDSSLILTGRLLNCVEFTLACTERAMSVNANSLKLLNGHLLSVFDDEKCRTEIRNAWNASLSMPYKECGTVRETTGHYMNIVELKHIGSQVVTASDRRVKLLCQMDPGTQQRLNYHVKVQPDNLSQKVRVISSEDSRSSSGRFELSILDEALNPTSLVNTGDEGYLEVKFISPFRKQASFKVTDLTATDLKEGNDLVLYDERGSVNKCSVHKDLVGEFVRVDDETMRSRIKFFAFPDSNRVYYKGRVKPCLENCDPEDCEPAVTGRLTRLRLRSEGNRRRPPVLDRTAPGFHFANVVALNDPGQQKR
ncbi:unnamed protein product [Soboliphyme baturini]|uniref:Apple domain-containing protein n=1 Tax=Soboliphyme baturini TaxID=241478 RepID=A0A183IMR6_9BILA|nr:unnamed protein product [Soboliphyme baturini]